MEMSGSVKNEGLGLSFISCFLKRSQWAKLLIAWFEYITEHFLDSFKKISWKFFFFFLYKHRIVFNHSEISLCLAILEAALEGFAMAIGTDIRKKLSVTVGAAGAGSLPVEWLWKAICPLTVTGMFGISFSYLSVCQGAAEGYMGLLWTGVMEEPLCAFLCVQEVREQGHSALNSSNECCMIYNTTVPN